MCEELSETPQRVHFIDDGDADAKCRARLYTIRIHTHTNTHCGILVLTPPHNMDSLPRLARSVIVLGGYRRRFLHANKSARQCPSTTL